MLNQEESMGFKEQLLDALDFLKKNEEQTQKELDYINNNIKSLEEKLYEINYKLSTIAVSNSNADLFSPTIKNNKDTRYNSLKEEKLTIEKQIQELEDNLFICINRKNNLDNLLNCFNTLRLNKTDSQTIAIDEDSSFNYDSSYDANSPLGLKILQTQENERKRIARDLHDSTVQNLTNMMHKTELCTRLIDLDHVRAKLELQTMIGTIKSTINDMRSIIYNLRPMSLDDLGLIDTIEKYIKDFKMNHNCEVELKIINKEVCTLPVINLTLFRIIQEATNNAIKHGKATNISIELEYKENSIALLIVDNGVGFTKKKNDSEKSIFSGYGLSMMKERILLLSGDINIESSHNKGTKILVDVPLRTIKEDM